MKTLKKRAVIVLSAGLLGFLVAALFPQLLHRDAPPEIPGLLWPDPRVLSAFTLEDQHAQRFDLDRLKGKWTFLFFGYTNCPDVCPTTLSVLASVEKQLKQTPEALKNSQFVFVSVDPKRDTPEHLGKYVGYFNKDFVGVTGPPEKLGALTTQLGIFYLLGEPDAAGNYLVDHTAAILLTDPKARLIGVFGAPHDPQTIVARFRRIRELIEG
ncbi:MAG: SCO family protein [Acidiferrobacterales bacterium]